MKAVLKFVADTFDLNVLVLFFISSTFLLLFDCKAYKKKGLKKEYKFSKFLGIFYICFGLVMYIFARFIKM
jgi:CBS domain containing-hemolysin-like protein